jgi:hypothetical protein
MNGLDLNAVGLAVTILGATVSASGVILSPKTAEGIAATQWDLNVALKAALLKQSRRAAIGLGLVAFGAALQLAAILVGH